MTLIENITPEYIKQLVPYASAKRELFNETVSDGSLWLNANESPFDNAERLFNRYPDFQPEQVIENYARYAGVMPEQVVASRGADEAIELLVRSFCVPGKDSIVINPPTYGMYKICAATSNVATLEVPLTEDFQLNVEQLLSIKDDTVKLVFICSPNNPTGKAIPKKDIVSILDACRDKALVVVDEAYIEFCPQQTVSDLLGKHDNLVILRTLSKAFALAGIRCGFTLADKAVIDMVKKVIAPYPIPAPVQQQAVQALTQQGISLMQEQVSQLNREKSAFVDELAAFPFIQKILPSDTNFVLMKVDNKSKLIDAMKQHNIYLRDQSSQAALQNHIRITIGSSEQMNAVLNVLKGL